jgi:hypothetical protein
LAHPNPGPSVETLGYCQPSLRDDGGEVVRFIMINRTIYHMMSGMARVVHYQDFTLDPATAAVRPQLYDDTFHF